MRGDAAETSLFNPHQPKDIGKTESHGCIRLANWNAKRLLKMISIGTPVVIEE